MPGSGAADSNGFEVGNTLTDILRFRARHTPTRILYHFPSSNGTPERSLNYAQLDCRAQALAQALHRYGCIGDRAILLYPTGPEFINAFFACLYAGIVAVPVPVPRRAAGFRNLERVAQDCDAALVLTTESVCRRLESLQGSEGLRRRIRWIFTDTLPPEPGGNAANEFTPTADTVAFLQYTSGSTTEPRGVVVSHGNLMQNIARIVHVSDMSESSHNVSWLPFYHDMGLIGAMLVFLHCGGTASFIDPLSFLQRPIRWLSLISSLKADFGMAPCFAFDHCVRRTTPDQRAALDLRHWRAVFCGSEPIRMSTLESFAEVFAPTGFRREAFVPCYGLAESTLFVSGGGPRPRPRAIYLSRADIEQRRIAPQPAAGPGVMSAASCGVPAKGFDIRIVDPDTCQPVSPTGIGEIWLAGPSVARGYWNNPDATERTFGGRLADTGEGPFLRTGDLGFLWDGDLVIIGRLKDVLIVGGRNFFPEDIERIAQDSHPAVRSHGCAAFACEDDNGLRVIVAAEIAVPTPAAAPGDIEQAIRTAVAESLDLHVHAVELVKAGVIPRTTSGKLRRSACREKLLSGELERAFADNE